MYIYIYIYIYNEKTDYIFQNIFRIMSKIISCNQSVIIIVGN